MKSEVGNISAPPPVLDFEFGLSDEGVSFFVSENGTGYRSSDLEKRTLQYGVRAIHLYRYLIKREEAVRRLANQFLRSSTSIGANVTEAQGAESRKDFAHKHSIARKEARESLFWLRLFRESGCIEPNKIDDLIRETDELVAILTTIVRRIKQE
jgi:four helix bundle protein